MWKRVLLGVAASAVLMGIVAANAQDGGAWRAESTNATSITSDIAIGKDKLEIDYFTYPIAPIRPLKPVEVSAVFDADVNAGISGMLYKLRIPARQRFLKKNTLCGDEDTQWMATYVSGKTLNVAFFSGDDMPVFTFDAISKSTALCGTFAYTR
ncbi:MAG TPA: hypothetical protein VMT38_06860 [Terracidiphilus sp.]|nr:hypothetical protein [Terracidiphilus sp.]